MLCRCFGEIGMCEITCEYQKVDGISEMINIFESEGMSRMNEN